MVNDGNTNEAVPVKPTGTKRKESTTEESASKAARYNTYIAGTTAGTVTNVSLIPTKNGYDGLKDNDEGNEANVKSPNNKKKTKQNSKKAATEEQKKVRIPPITIFDQNRTQVEALLKEIGVTQYALKNLRHAMHLYCDTVDDFKKVKAEIVK